MKPFELAFYSIYNLDLSPDNTRYTHDYKVHTIFLIFGYFVVL